jgi:hypothetical protein
LPAGRQAQTLLGALSRRWDELTAIAGPFTPYIAIPEPGPATWAHDPSQLAESRQLITVRGGQIIPLRHDTRAGSGPRPCGSSCRTRPRHPACLKDQPASPEPSFRRTSLHSA